MKTHKDLDVWKSAMKLVKSTYQITKCFPPEERFGLTQQMRRASVSIPSNIAEGAARLSRKEYIHFLSVSSGSLSELETQFLIAVDLEFLSNADDILNHILAIKSMLRKLIQKLRSA